jgi:predicted O-methyltransferase YrrM
VSSATSLRGRWRRLKLGLPTILGLRPRGWFIPHRYADLIAAPGAHAPYPVVEALFERSAAQFAEVLDRMDAETDLAQALDGLLDQSWFPALDAAVAYTLVRARRPKRIVEVGSGHSTRVLSRAAAENAEIVAIDPEPRADIGGLANVRILRAPLQQAPADAFSELARGDVLFIDSSHILMPGSDVDLLLNRLLPRLPSGVMVHLHDVFLPFDYPPEWGWRNYNEQQGVVPLLASGAYRPLFSSVWSERRLAARLANARSARLPRPAEALATSLWLEKQ